MKTKKIIFSLPMAALRNTTGALLLGDFNNWNLDQAIKMERGDNDSMTAIVTLEIGKTYEYRFLLSDGTWTNDWAAHKYVHKSLFGVDNSVIHVMAEPNISENKKQKTAVIKEPAKKGSVKTNSITDDLTTIEGITPAIAKLLEKKKIGNFKALSKATIKTLKSILDEEGNHTALYYKTWPKQAKLAAAEHWNEFMNFQKELTALNNKK